MHLESSDSREKKKRIEIPRNGTALKEMLGPNISRRMTMPSGEMLDVVDVDLLVGKLRGYFGKGGGRSEAVTAQLIQGVVTMFPDPVLTEDQVREGDLKPAMLFYYPNNIGEATHTAAIKNARFHLLLHGTLESLRLRTPQPLRKGDSSDMLSLLEATTAILLLHPKYGDGFRDEKGVLYVRSRDTKEYEKFSGTFLEEYGLHKNYFLYRDATHQNRGGGDRSLRDGINDELPNLVKNNVLVPARDLKQITLGSEKIEGRALEREGVSSSGSRMISGVLHYIGKEFYGQPVRIVRIGSQLGCVIDESNPSEPHILKLFSIIERAHSVNKSGTYLANKTLTRPRAFSAEALGLSQYTNETRLQYLERCEAVDRGLAHLILDVARQHPAIADLFNDAQPALLAEVAKTAYWLHKEGNRKVFDTFVSKYHRDGLRAFLSLEYDRSMGEKILEFAQSSAPEYIKRTVFELYGRIIDATGDVASDIVAEKMGKAARDVLARAHQFKDDPEKIQQLLNKISVEGQVLIGTFRALRGVGVVQSVEDIEGVLYEELPGTALLRDRPALEKLLTLYRRNYEPYTGEMLAKKFRENLSRAGALVHRIVFGEKVVAFMLIVPSGEKRLHVSALNVDPELVGVKAGPLLLKKVLDLVQEGNTIEAEAVPNIADQYVGQYGFVRLSDRPKPDDDGAPIFKLELRPPSTAPSSTVPQTGSDGGRK